MCHWSPNVSYDAVWSPISIKSGVCVQKVISGPSLLSAEGQTDQSIESAKPQHDLQNSEGKKVKLEVKNVSPPCVIDGDWQFDTFSVKEEAYT
jgi:hypothetical protein